MTLAVLQPPGWKRPKGYANGMAGVKAGSSPWRGQIGWDTEGRVRRPGWCRRWSQALLQRAGGAGRGQWRGDGEHRFA